MLQFILPGESFQAQAGDPGVALQTPKVEDPDLRTGDTKEVRSYKTHFQRGDDCTESRHAQRFPCVFS